MSAVDQTDVAGAEVVAVDAANGERPGGNLSTGEGLGYDEPADAPTGEELAGLGLKDPAAVRAALEGVLFVADQPLAPADIAAALGIPEAAVRTGLAEIAAGLDERGAGTELRETAGAVRLYTRSSVAPAVERFLRDGRRTRLSPAALETLAVVAYRQPVTRGRIAAIRGVNVDGVIRTLAARGLIADVGVDPTSGAGLYATTELFLTKIGANGLDELPSLAPLLPSVDELDGLDPDAF
ncbi:MAG: SMC-Scp complex subunit ScpB [bacterium]